MKNKIFFFSSIIFVLMVCVSLVYTIYTAKNECVKLSDVKYSGKYKDIVKGRKTAQDDMIEFSCSKGNIPYDKEWDCYYLQEGMKLEDINIKCGSSTVILWEEELTDDLIKQKTSNNESIKLLAYNDKQYSELKIVFTKYPIVHIQLLDDKKIEYKYCYALTNTYSAEYGIQSYYTKYKLRGASSLNYEKKSYSMQTLADSSEEQSASILGMRDNSRYALNSMYEDGSKIRDRFSLNLWKEIGAYDNDNKDYYGADFQYVDVFLNDDYLGLYGLTEVMTDKKLNLCNDDKTQDSLFFVSLGVDEWPSLDEIRACMDKKLSCGVIDMKYPKSLKSKYEYTKLYDYVSFLYDKKNDDYTKLIDMADVDNCIDYEILLQSICAVDNSWKNYYFLWKDSKKNDGKGKMYVLPWDLDLSLGLMWHLDRVYSHENFLKYSYFKADGYTDIQEFSVFDKLLEEDYQQVSTKLYDRWHELRQGVLSNTNVNKLIREMYDEIYSSGSVKRDSSRWRKGVFNEDVEEIVTFMDKRLTYLDKYYQNVCKKGDR